MKCQHCDNEIRHRLSKRAIYCSAICRNAVRTEKRKQRALDAEVDRRFAAAMAAIQRRRRVA